MATFARITLYGHFCSLSSNQGPDAPAGPEWRASIHLLLKRFHQPQANAAAWTPLTNQQQADMIAHSQQLAHASNDRRS